MAKGFQLWLLSLKKSTVLRNAQIARHCNWYVSKLFHFESITNKIPSNPLWMEKDMGKTGQLKFPLNFTAWGDLGWGGSRSSSICSHISDPEISGHESQRKASQVAVAAHALFQRPWFRNSAPYHCDTEASSSLYGEGSFRQRPRNCKWALSHLWFNNFCWRGGSTGSKHKFPSPQSTEESSTGEVNVVWWLRALQVI